MASDFSLEDNLTHEKLMIVDRDDRRNANVVMKYYDFAIGFLKLTQFDKS